MAAPLSQQLIWKERELAGERALRQGWEQECRRVLEENKILRALVSTDVFHTLARTGEEEESGDRDAR
jgi:hypothetical protein